MRRARIETLEKRQMFAADNLSDVVAAHGLGNCPNWFVDPNPPVVGESHNRFAGDSVAIVDYIDPDEIGTPPSLGKMHLENISLGVTTSPDATVEAGPAATVDTVLGYSWGVSQTRVVSSAEGAPHANADLAHTQSIGVLGFSWGVTQTGTTEFGSPWNDTERALRVSIAGGQEGEEVTLNALDDTIGPRSSDATVAQGFLLPYMEQENLYKTYNVTDITDGSSNTMMFATKAGGEVVADLLVNETGSTQGIIAILIGLTVDPSDPGGDSTRLNLHGAAVDTSRISLTGSAPSIDVWEHAYLDQPGATTNGIIAILIGLTVDPSDPSGNTFANANFAFADGSVYFIGADVSGAAALVSSAEFFARFADTALDDEALVATTYGRGVSSFYDLLVSSVRGGAAAQITHDVEFEKWARASQFDRGYVSLELENVLISGLRGDHDRSDQTQSILHEDNEFSFPRM